MYPDEAHEALSLCLRLYGDSLYDAGRLDEACASWQESVNLNRPLYTSNPDNETYRDAYIIALRDVADSYVITGRADDACASWAELVAVYRELFRKDDRKWLKSLVRALCDYGDALRDANRTTDALIARREPALLYSRLYVLEPDRYRAPYLHSLRNYPELLYSSEIATSACGVCREQWDEIPARSLISRAVYGSHPSAHIIRAADGLPKVQFFASDVESESAGLAAAEYACALYAVGQSSTALRLGWEAVLLETPLSASSSSESALAFSGAMWRLARLAALHQHFSLALEAANVLQFRPGKLAPPFESSGVDADASGLFVDLTAVSLAENWNEEALKRGLVLLNA